MTQFASTPVTRAFDAHHALLTRARLLRQLADAFVRTGNQAVADELEEHAAEIERYINAYRKAFYDQIDERVRASFENSNNVLGAALAGVELTKADQGTE